MTKSIEKLRREFEEKFCENGDFKGDEYWVEFDHNDIWNFFEPHLNSRNLLERLKGLKMKERFIGDGCVCKTCGGFLPAGECDCIGYNQAVSEINSKLDEFIESEKESHDTVTSVDKTIVCGDDDYMNM